MGKYFDCMDGNIVIFSFRCLLLGNFMILAMRLSLPTVLPVDFLKKPRLH